MVTFIVGLIIGVFGGILLTALSVMARIDEHD